MLCNCNQGLELNRALDGCSVSWCPNSLLTVDEECEQEKGTGLMPEYCTNQCKFKTDYDCRYEYNSTVTKNCKCWSKLTHI